MEAYILDAVRTPRGKAKETGALHGVRPIELVGGLMKALAARNGLDSSEVDDVVLGCVTATGDQGANIARIAALYAGWSDRVSGGTVNRFCASGLDACGIAAARVTARMDRLIVAGGVESCSRVPMFSDGGAWFGDPDVAAKTGFVHMGVAADLLATRAGLTREQLDAYAARSQARAAMAREMGRFRRSLVPVLDVDGLVLLDNDELIRPGTTVEALRGMPPGFAGVGAKGQDAIALSRYPDLERIEHLHTLGTSPAMADGAALVLIGRSGGPLKPRARISAVANAAVEPVQMLTGNLEATTRALEMAGLEPEDVDLYEVNESFAAVPVQFADELDIDEDKLNANGGAIALGHPLGATGGVLLATLLDELERRDLAIGAVSICGGAGVASAVVIERV